MQLFRKITEALDKDDNGGNGGKSPTDAVPVAAQDPTAAPLVSSGILDAPRPPVTGTGNEGSSPMQCPAISSEAARSTAATKGAGGEWEVVSPAPTTSTPRVAPGGDVGTDGEMRPRATDALAEEAARILRSAATAAEALAPRLSSTLRRAEAAEAEVLRLRAVLEIAEARIKDMEKQQEKLTEGFIKEIQQRDAEIANFKASAAAEAKHSDREGLMTLLTPRPASGEVEGAEAIEVLTFTEEGKLGIEFDQTNDCLKILSFVAPGSQSEGRLFVGDEVVSVSGVTARNLSWEEMQDVLSARPVVFSVRRAEGSGPKPSNPLLRTLAGWTRALTARTGVQEESETPRREEGAVPGDDLSNLEVCNRPFFELVRASISEAVAADSPLSEEEQFEQWLRQFHSEREDEWYVSNHVRLINAFKPHWDEVVEAHRALAAS